MGAGNRNGTISHMSFSEMDSPTAREDPEELKNKTTTTIIIINSNLQPFKLGTNSSAYF